MANKKPGKRPAQKKPAAKAVSPESAARSNAAEPKATRKKSPEVKAAVRVTKKNVKAVKPTSKSATPLPELPDDTLQSLVAARPAQIPGQFDSTCVADSQQTAAAACPPQYAQVITHDEIRHLAYLKWEAAGRPD